MPETNQPDSEIQDQIQKLEAVRPILGDEVVNQKIAELKRQINTAGGAYVEGKVETQGGDFVVRDKITIFVAERLWRDFISKMQATDLRPSTAAYLDYLLDRHRYLSFRGMGISDRIPLRLPLLDLYVPLKARQELPEGETWRRELKLAGRELPEAEVQALRLGEPQPVLKILQQHPGVVILGDPGAGKTTFLKYLALRLAAGEGEALGLGERLPILVPLAAFANTLQAGEVRLDDFIAAYFTDIGADLPVGAMLVEALKAGKALILLDGLDEVKDVRLRHTVVERVTDFYAFHRRPGNKFVLTSRVVGYRTVRPTAEGLVECTLVDFEDEEITAFVNLWTVALEKQAQGDTALARLDAERERHDLLEAVQNNAGVRRLAANPLLLTILALMKRQGVTLPERRVQLYDQYISTLLSTWNRARSLSGRAPGRDLDEVQTVRILAPLALWMHEVSPGAGLVKSEDLRRELESLFTERGEADPEAAARQFLLDVREHAALLLERGPEEYGFIHLTFEEYLAAVAIALRGQGDARPIVEVLSRHVGEQAWREVSLLAVGYLGIRQQLPKVAGEVIEALLESQPGPPGEAVVLAGEAVLDAWPGGVRPQDKERVIQALLPTLQSAVVRSELRRRAGLLLGRLGWLPEDLDGFVEVPVGEFLYGENRRRQNISYHYWIAKYPVTNLQYSRFVAENGYKQREYWSQAGWKWLQKDGREQPPYLQNVEFGNLIFPVVTITWFEAEVYCRWLSRQSLSIPLPRGYTVRLPTEAEWERAARGVDGREYPWGKEFDPAFANTGESDTEGSSAVCTYPQGASPAGAWDMSGNVWEWTITKEGESRVVRGGSWSSDRLFARCSYRYRYIPGNFADNRGFRVVVSLADSGS